jgi:hypothetical protein
MTCVSFFVMNFLRQRGQIRIGVASIFHLFSAEVFQRDGSIRVSHAWDAS